jgi:AcrR family transcriptional regulator
MPVMTKPTARERLAEAAFALFDERGYEQTTVDDITERAGLGRTTFFRHYRTKEDVIFPDHDRLLEQVEERLRTSGQGSALGAVADAVRLVLLHYVDEGDLARRRYALTSKVPALHDREIVSGARYQRLFREFIAGWRPEPGRTEPGRPEPGRPDPSRPDAVRPRSGESAQLRAEMAAAALVAAHNHVLRRWLRGESPDPVREVDEALRLVTELFAAPVGEADGGTTVVAFRTGQDIDSLIPALRRIAGQPA